APDIPSNEQNLRSIRSREGHHSLLSLNVLCPGYGNVFKVHALAGAESDDAAENGLRCRSVRFIRAALTIGSAHAHSCDEGTTAIVRRPRNQVDSNGDHLAAFSRS